MTATKPLDDTAEELPNDSTTVTNCEDWKHLTDFIIPDHTQTHVTAIPQFQTIYEAYHSSYTDSTTTNATRMQHGKALAFILLTHYYPTSQGYTVEPSSLGPIVKHGLNFMIASEFGLNSINPPPPKKPLKKGKKKGNNTHRGHANFSEEAYVARNVFNLDWDWIRPEDIAAFIVMRNVKLVDQNTGTVTDEKRPYTYLAIIIDDLESLPRHLSLNTMHRSDVLADALCRTARLDEGYGILLYGPRLELYAYNAGAKWIYYKDSESDDMNHTSEDVEQDIEPKLKLLVGAGGKEDLVLDMRSAELSAVDEAMRQLHRRNVRWVDSITIFGQAGMDGHVAASAIEVDGK